MRGRRRFGLGLAAVASVLGFATAQALAGCAEAADMRQLTVSPPHALLPGEALALVVETGQLGEGDVLTLRDADGHILGSVIETVLMPGAQKQIVAILHEEPVTLNAVVNPRGDANASAPRDDELLSLELVPMEVDP